MGEAIIFALIILALCIPAYFFVMVIHDVVHYAKREIERGRARQGVAIIAVTTLAMALFMFFGRGIAVPP